MSAPRLDAPVREGLDQVEALKPGSGYAELLAGARGGAAGVEGYARAELGWHFLPTGSAFAFGEGTINSADPAWQAGVGARVSW